MRSDPFWKEFLKILFISLIIVIPFRLFVAQPFIVEGASMDPTFKHGDYLIVDEVSYRFHEPLRGSVLIFRYPKDPKKFFIKRVIGLPGETIFIKNGIVSIKGVEDSSDFVLEEPYVKFPKNENLSYILGKDEYFVMGDNRIGSADSRVWGALPEENIIGRPIIQVYPPAIFPGVREFKE